MGACAAGREKSDESLTIPPVRLHLVSLLFLPWWASSINLPLLIRQPYDYRSLSARSSHPLLPFGQFCLLSTTVYDRPARFPLSDQSFSCVVSPTAPRILLSRSKDSVSPFAPPLPPASLLLACVIQVSRNRARSLVRQADVVSRARVAVALRQLGVSRLTNRSFCWRDPR